MLIGGVRRVVRPAWDDLGPQRGVEREHAMKANEMEPGTRDERSQAWSELERGHHDRGGPVMVRGFELQHDLTSTRALQPFGGKGGASDVATQVFECVALMGGAAHVGMQAKALCTDTAWLGMQPFAAGNGQRLINHRQHLLPCPGSERNAVGTG